MAFNIEVINIGALTVQLITKSLDNSLSLVTSGDPNHVYEQVEISKIFLSIYDKLSTTTTPIYHRLKYTQTGNVNPWDYVRPRDIETTGSYYIDLVPDTAVHTTQAGGFSTAENMYDLTAGHVLAQKIVGRQVLHESQQTLTFRFELQYQIDPTPLTPTGRNPAGVWVSYSQAQPSNIIVDGGALGEQQINVRTAYTSTVPNTNPNYTPGTGDKLTRLYKRRTTTNATDVTLPETLTIGGITYTAEAGPDSGFPIEVKQILFTDDTTFVVIRPEVDFVLLLPDDVNSSDVDGVGAQPIDDVVTQVIPLQPQIHIHRHIIRSSNDMVLLYDGLNEDVDIKVFRGKTTYLFTNLIWPSVRVHTASLSVTDPQSGLSFNSTGSNFGFFDFDNGETRIGVTRDGSGRVYLKIKMSMHATSMLFDTLRVALGAPVVNSMSSIDVETTFDDAPANFNRIL